MMDRKEIEQYNLNSRAALICSTIANVHRKRGRAYKVSDFMPKIQKEKHKENHLQIVEMLNAAIGGVDKRK